MFSLSLAIKSSRRRICGIRCTIAHNPLVPPPPKPVVPLGNFVCIHCTGDDIFPEIITSVNVNTTAAIQTPTAIASEATSVHKATGAMESRRWVSHHDSQDMPKEKVWKLRADQHIQMHANQNCACSCIPQKIK